MSPLNQWLREANKGWHGVKLNQPDWSSGSHTVVLSAEIVKERHLVHWILNAYWEPLDFELPAAGDGFWRRWIDTSLDSPEDIVRWDDARPFTGCTYRAGPPLGSGPLRPGDLRSTNGIADIELVFLFLLVFIIAFGLLARGLGMPYTIIMVAGGLRLGLVPGIPDVSLNPDLVLLVVRRLCCMSRPGPPPGAISGPTLSASSCWPLAWWVHRRGCCPFRAFGVPGL